MAVYTEVSDEELERFLTQYDIGAAISCKGIAEGVENSNYLLQTEDRSYILTLYEKRVAREDLPFFLGLMDHLAARGIASRRSSTAAVTASAKPSSSVISKPPSPEFTCL